MVMALIVLLGFGLLFMFAFDEGLQGGEQSIASVIAGQAKEIERSQEGIADGRKTLSLAPARVTDAKELTRLKRENQALRDNIVNLKKEIEGGNADIVRRQRASEAYKDEYRANIRGKAKGETLATLETRSGAVYKDVSIREVTAIGIQIRHADGQKRIPFEDLPEAMNDRFQFDPKQKNQAVAAEAAARTEHEAAVAVADGLADQEAAKQKGQDAVLTKQKQMLEIAAKESQINSLKDGIRDLENEMSRASAAAASARAAGRMHIDRSGGISGDIRSKQNRIATLRAEVGQMKSSL